MFTCFLRGKVLNNYKITKLLFFLTTLALFGFFLATSDAGTFLPKPETKQPKIVFESKECDIGVVKPGEKAKGVFILHNKGVAPLFIEKVSPS